MLTSDEEDIHIHSPTGLLSESGSDIVQFNVCVCAVMQGASSWFME